MERDEKIKILEKEKRKRQTKREKYKTEREEIISEMNKIIGINGEKKNIYLYELEHNEKIKEYIEKNIKNIKRYHKVGSWGYFSNEKSKGRDNIIGLIRTLYMDNDYEIVSKLKINTFEGVKKQYTMLMFYKK